MPTTSYKVLGQVVPAATTLTTLYTAPSLTSSVISTLVVNNLGLSTTYRVAVRPAGAAIDPKHYLVYEASINQYDSVLLTIGITLAATDVISVYAGTANVTFQAYGTEIT
jgi:hypothetical protein